MTSKYTTKWARGSCFGEKLGGGRCAGIPEVCDTCRLACGNQRGIAYTNPYNEPTPPPPPKDENCIHQCRGRSNGCTTEATWTIGNQLRYAQGSCFSERFGGGECSGLPEVCQSCRSVCGNRKGQVITSQTELIMINSNM